MKRNFYFEHPLMAMHDARMNNLLEQEGLKGTGAYWFIMEKLAMLPQPCANANFLRPFCKGKKMSLSYLLKIICDYQLFDFLPDGYFTPCELNPPLNLEQKAVKKEQKTAESVSEKPVSEAKNDENQQKVFRETPENDSEETRQQPETSTLAQNDTKNTNNYIINIITTATEEEKEETAAAAKTPVETDDGGCFRKPCPNVGLVDASPPPGGKPRSSPPGLTHAGEAELCGLGP